MPNIKSAKKRVELAKAANEKNKANKSELKTIVKKFEAAAAEGKRTEAEGAYKVAVKVVDQAAAYTTAVKFVDKAVKKGILHKNTAARKKSSMTLKLNKLA